MPIITQISNINNFGTAIAKPINLHAIGKFVGGSIKKVPVKAMFILTVLEILLSESRSLL